MQISLFLSLIFAKFSVGIVDLGLKAHVKSEVTLLELQDPELPKSLSYSVNGFGFQGMMILTEDRCPKNHGIDSLWKIKRSER